MDKVQRNRNAVKKWLDTHRNPSGIIYRFQNVITGEIYIGSTRSPLKKRWYQAVAAANAGRTDPVYENIRRYGKEVFEIECLHECTPEEDLRSTENEYIELHNPELNRNCAKKVK